MGKQSSNGIQAAAAKESKLKRKHNKKNTHFSKTFKNISYNKKILFFTKGLIYVL